MKLLIETNDLSEFEIINEDTNGKGLYIKGPFIQTEIVNRNGRMYKKDITKKEIDRYIAEKIKTNKALGELNHRPHPEVNPERAAIKIVELTESGNDFIGKAKVLESLPMGSIVGGLIREGVQLGVSSRALGSLKNEKNYKVVCEDFRLMTAADVVSDPSAPDAFVTAIMENKEWVWENGVLLEKESEIKENINKLSRYNKLTDEKLLEVFQQILKLI